MDRSQPSEGVGAQILTAVSSGTLLWVLKFLVSALEVGAHRGDQENCYEKSNFFDFEINKVF